jgi:hypothetical protein
MNTATARPIDPERLADWNTPSAPISPPEAVSAPSNLALGVV